jgi:hypothetical protein
MGLGLPMRPARVCGRRPSSTSPGGGNRHSPELLALSVILVLHESGDAWGYPRGESPSDGGRGGRARHGGYARRTRGRCLRPAQRCVLCNSLGYAHEAEDATKEAMTRAFLVDPSRGLFGSLCRDRRKARRPPNRAASPRDPADVA